MVKMGPRSVKIKEIAIKFSMSNGDCKKDTRITEIQENEIQVDFMKRYSTRGTDYVTFYNFGHLFYLV